MMIMEYAELKGLRSFLESKKKISWEIKYRISLDIAKGLNCLHSLNIAHRDLVILKSFMKCFFF